MAPDIHTLSGAYALDAVEPDERAEFEQHLAVCEACADEVAALRVAATAIGESLAETPPLELRARIVAEAGRTPQLPPLTARPSAARHHGRSRFTRGLVAAAAVIVLGGGAALVVRDALVDEPAPSVITAAEVFGSADARVDAIALKGGQVRVGISKELGLIAVDGADMPAPPKNKVYQLWLVHDGEHTSLSVMEGDVTTAVQAIPAAGDLAVTVEPAGGSEQPTSEPILTVDPTDL